MKKLLIGLLLGTLILIAGCEVAQPNEAPVITVDEDLYVEVHDDDFDLADYVTVTDDLDGDIVLIPSMVDYDDFDVNVVGNHIVIIQVYDTSGVSSSVMVTIHVQDLTPPVMTLNGLSEVQLYVGDEYTEAGVMVSDNYDSGVSYTVVGSVDTTTAGVYTLEYHATDASGNEAATVVRTVTVLPGAPTLQLSNIETTKDSVTFQISETDPQDIAELTGIELYLGDTLVQTLTDLNERTFSDLYSNTTYTIKVTASYDRNDGNGLQTVTVSQPFITLAYADPNLDITSIQPTRDGVSFVLQETDEDDLAHVTAIELYDGDTYVASLSDLGLRSFSGLLSNHTYIIQVATSYDLHDGNGPQVGQYSQSFITLSYAEPTVTLYNVGATTDTITFDLNVNDPDEVGTIQTIALYCDSELIESLSDLTVRELSNLLSGTEYELRVTYQYNLNDGNNAQTNEVSVLISTQTNVIPSITLSNIAMHPDTITFDLDEIDTSNVGTIQSIELIEGDSVVQRLSDTSLRFFEGIQYNRVYTIRVVYEYDLSDGTEPVTIQLTQRQEWTDSGIIVHGDMADLPNAIFLYDTGGWAGLADATANVISQQLVVDITDSGDEFWAIQYTFNDFEFKANTHYLLSFEASSTIDRAIDISIGARPSASQWIQIDHDSFSLTGEMSVFEFEFTTVEAVTEFAQIVFELGAALQEDGSYLETAPHSITMDNFVVYELHDVTDDINDVYEWFSLVRHENGLHASSVPGQVYSLYDNALAAMVYTMMGEYSYAEGVFDYFDARIETELQDQWGGFVQLRNLDGSYVDGPIGNRWLGDNAWLLIAIHYYQEQTGTNDYHELADALEAWILSLQNEDGGLSSGYDPTGFMTYPVTEGMIDAYSAVSGYTTFHQDLENYLLQTRIDSQYGIFMAWPDHPTYQYSLDTVGWGYLAFNGWSSEILDVADQLFGFEENDIYGYSADIDRDTIFTELTLTMAAAYNKAGNMVKANQLIEYMETLFFVINDHTKGLPYTTSQATGYADFPLWDTVDTEAHLSGNAWYLFAKLRCNPYGNGLEGKDPLAIDTVWNAELTLSDRVYNWIKSNQLPNGLQKSNEIPVMISLYDNALAALVYTMNGDYARAEAIFDFFDAIVDTELKDQYGGFAQFRDVNGVIVGGTIGKRWLGDNAWLLVAINQYHYETGTNTYSYMASELDAWIRSLQNPDGSLSSGVDEGGNMMGPVTEAMIDAYNAVLGYDDFHTDLLFYFESERYDSVNNVLVSWPGNPDYLYAIDMSSWGYLAMNDMPISVLDFADQHFMMVEDGITGYCIDEDLDSIWTEHSLQMAVAFRIAGGEYEARAESIILNMNQLMIVSTLYDDALGLPYATNQATMYGSDPLWDGVDTDIYLSGSAWYLMAVEGYNPFAAGLIDKHQNADTNDAFYMTD